LGDCKLSSDPDWKLLEKVVTILERTLADEAVVKRNVNLPILTSKEGRTAQCDAVIYQGNEPRQTISIVEVQKRKGKPKINDFRGWVGKLRDIGGQHLICVSQSGFPKSIEEAADIIGPTVRLLTLKELERNEWPIPLAFLDTRMFVIKHEELVRIEMRYPRPSHQPRFLPTSEHKLRDKIFRFEDGVDRSPVNLVDELIFKDSATIERFPKGKSFHFFVDWDFSDGKPKVLGRISEGEWVPLQGLFIEMKLLISTREMKWNLSEYKQLDWEDELAWVIKGETMDAEQKSVIVAPLTRKAPGKYRMEIPFSLSEFDMYLALGKKGHKVKRYFDDDELL
jgi:hypothetical protein